MKMYNNGPRKAMMYGGMSKRKPMMYGGTAKKKPRKKAQAGGMMTATQGQQNQMQNQTMQKPKMPMMGMKGGGKAFPDLTGDGKVDKKDILKGRGVPGFQEGGRTKSDRQMLAESGKTLSDADTKARDFRKIRSLIKGLSDADIERIKEMLSYKPR
jgi:hypothetical protein